MSYWALFPVRALSETGSWQTEPTSSQKEERAQGTYWSSCCCSQGTSASLWGLCSGLPMLWLQGELEAGALLWPVHGGVKRETFCGVSFFFFSLSFSGFQCL